WMLTTTLTGHYIPVCWLSFGLDYAIWGMRPFGYHLTNVLIHAANAALFYLIALRLLARATSLAGAPGRLAPAAAALFVALHPLRAESVAWATERRDVLSGLFFLATVLTYLAAVETRGRSRRWRLAGSAALYALALLSKSIVMSLPLVLILIDVYPLGRLPSRWVQWRDRPTRAVLVEKLPFLLLGLAGALTAYSTLPAHHYLTPMERYGAGARVAMAGYSLWFYAARTAMPIA